LFCFYRIPLSDQKRFVILSLEIRNKKADLIENGSRSLPDAFFPGSSDDKITKTVFELFENLFENILGLKLHQSTQLDELSRSRMDLSALAAWARNDVYA